MCQIEIRTCDSATNREACKLAYDHLDQLSPRDKSAFWASLPNLLHQWDGKSQFQHNEQLAEILCNTLENMKGYSYRDIATIAISLAKIMKQVESHGQRSATGSLHQNLHTLLIGINSENKQVILNKVAKTSAPILSEFDARCLSNLIYSYCLSEYMPKVEDGRTISELRRRESLSLKK